MLSLCISVAISLAIYFSTYAELGGWSYFWAALAFIAVQIIVGLLLRGRIMAVQNNIQQVVMEGQKRLTAKMNQMQQRGGGNVKVMQKVLETEQYKFIQEALAMTSELEKFNKWSLMMAKQVATMRMQFYFQLKEYDKVDSLLPKALYLDPMIYGMKMARLYKLNDEKGLEKTFRKGKARFKGAKSTIIYATYSWALVKKGNIDEAIKVLNEAVRKNDNEALVNNLNFLKNGKVKQFSNAGLGDMWYALYLEEVKQKPVRVKQRAARGGRPF